jgi:hypothetical protein
MLRRSKRKPDNITAGKKVTNTVIWLATNWLFTAEEIDRPMPRATSKYSIEAAVSIASEPRNGTEKRNLAASRHSTRPMTPRTK